MATLNMTETESLKRVQAILEGILREGFDPKKADAGDRQEQLRAMKIRESVNSVRTVVTMKGYYPK